MRTKLPQAIKNSDYREVASEALIRILEPLSGFAIENGLSIEEVYRLLRIAAIGYVAASQSKTNISGIAASTGIPRAEVSRLLKQPSGVEAKYSVNDQITNAILTAWRQDPKFTLASGQPAPLKLYGRGPTFDNLARAHGRGIPTRAILEELVRTNSISIEANQVVRQRAEVAVESGISIAATKFFGERVTELIATLMFNMKHTGSSRFLSRASTGDVPIDALPLLRRQIKARSQEFITDIQELLVQAAVSARETEAETTSLGVTAFYFEEVARNIASGGKRKNYRRIKTPT